MRKYLILFQLKFILFKYVLLKLTTYNFSFLPLQNRTVFMFRIDSEHVVDATRNGGLARYREIPKLI